jgi:hypothetical protein
MSFPASWGTTDHPIVVLGGGDRCACASKVILFYEVVNGFILTG